MLKNYKKGFTLIELLVVIAIIGILSSVVLASLNSARNKGADAAVKANMANIRAETEIAYDSYGCYKNSPGTCSSTYPGAVSGACPAASGGNTIFGHPTVNAQIAAATKAGLALNACSSTAGGTAWAVAVVFKSAIADTANSGWCVDTTGKAIPITVATLNQAGITAEVSGGACVE